MNIEIANRLFEMRKKKGLSQEELAEQIGVSRQAVSKWERAESSPEIENLILLARLYNTSLDELLMMGEPITQENTSKDESVIPINQNDIGLIKAKRKQEIKRYLFVFPLPLVLILIYLLIGFVWGAWHPGWLLFILIPIYYGSVAVM